MRSLVKVIHTSRVSRDIVALKSSRTTAQARKMEDGIRFKAQSTLPTFNSIRTNLEVSKSEGSYFWIKSA
jgi:hypothetical protein